MLRKERPGFQAAGSMVHMGDGSVVRGAKRGGITDHIAGPHMIPNVGREAMVPAEVVRRAPKKPTRRELWEQEESQKAQKQKEFAIQLARTKTNKVKEATKKHKKGRSLERSRSRSRADPSRSRQRSRQRSQSSQGGPSPERSGAEDDGRGGRGDPPAHSAGAEEQAKPAKQPKARSRSEEAAARRVEVQQVAEAEEREKRRAEVEKRKLEELEQARKRKVELDGQRRGKLAGLFALTEDDMDETADAEARKAKTAKERQMADERRSLSSGAAMSDMVRAGFVGGSSSSGAAAAAAGAPRLVPKEGLTALDIDGTGHDHQFASVWKNWDASKKDDPGEIARHFMKVSAAKRRGYDRGSREERR